MEEKIVKKTKKKIEVKEKVVETKTEISTKSTKKSQSADSKGLIAVVRIAGEVKVKPELANTLYRLRLRRKYSCVLINSSNKGLMGMLWKVRHSVAYGDIDKELLVKLLSARGKIINGKKIDSEKAASELISGKELEELGFKPFFRLHPPRKGINSKLQYPLGVLGNNKNDINKLVERML
jgi:large subunit ribosomal protein L30